MTTMGEEAYASQHSYQSLCVITNAKQSNIHLFDPSLWRGIFLHRIDHVCSRRNDRDSPRLMD